MASEAGVCDLAADEIVEKGRLGPGQMLAVDLEAGSVLARREDQVARGFATPYGAGCASSAAPAPRTPAPAPRALRAEELLQLQTAFGFTAEDVE